MRVGWLTLCALATCFHLLWGIGRLQLEQQKHIARVAVERLGILSAAFSGKEAEFWSSMGRSSAPLDPWGQAYRWDPGPPSLWRSAGPDGQYATADDLKALVAVPEPEAAPLPEGPNSLGAH